MSRLKKIANINVLDNVFEDKNVYNTFITELNQREEYVLDQLIGDENADDLVDKIIDKMKDPDSNTYNAIQDYISDKKVDENDLPTEEEIAKAIENIVTEEINLEKIENAIEEMKKINGDDGIASEYWNNRL